MVLTRLMTLVRFLTFPGWLVQWRRLWGSKEKNEPAVAERGRLGGGRVGRCALRTVPPLEFPGAMARELVELTIKLDICALFLTPASPQQVQRPLPPEGAKKGTEVLGTREVAREEGFAEEIVQESERLPVFGADTFQIDVSTLSPGPIDPETYLIAPGDRLLLQVWGQLNREQELEVSRDLYVTLQGGGGEQGSALGRVYLGG